MRIAVLVTALAALAVSAPSEATGAELRPVPMSVEEARKTAAKDGFERGERNSDVLRHGVKRCRRYPQLHIACVTVWQRLTSWPVLMRHCRQVLYMRAFNDGYIYIRRYDPKCR